MSQSQKFPAAVHVLIALALYREEFVNSEELAKSIGTNPVVVRRLLQALKKAGLVRSKGGVYGGTGLAKDAEQITLLDVERAVQPTGSCCMPSGNQACWIARGIHDVVPDALHEAERARCESLARQTIAQLASEVAGHRPRRQAASGH